MITQQSLWNKPNLTKSFNAYKINRSRLAVLPTVVWSFVLILVLVLGLVFVNNFIPIRVLSSFLPFIEPQENTTTPKDLIVAQRDQLQQQATINLFDPTKLENGQFLISKDCIAEIVSTLPSSLNPVYTGASQWLTPVLCNQPLQGIQLVGKSGNIDSLDNPVVELSLSKAIIYGQIENLDIPQLDQAWDTYIANLLQEKSIDSIRLGQSQFILGQGCSSNVTPQACELWQLDQFGLQNKLLNQSLSEVSQDGGRLLDNYPILKFSPLQNEYPQNINITAFNPATESLAVLKIDTDSGQVLGIIKIVKSTDPTNYQRFLPL